MAGPHQQIIGRYALFDEIASGGMAAVHLGRLLGPVGFSRTVAIKRLHRQFARDPEFVSMFVDEARVAARIRHPNVVPTLDVVRTADELFLVMEYVQGEALSRLLRRARQYGRPLAVGLVAPVLIGVLHGLHAAHNATGERGEKLHIVHRDVSPQNVLVGIDGVPRVFDFGIAKATCRLQTTREGQIKGKLAYMAPEQVSGGEVSPRTDVYAAAVVFWEALANRRLFEADNEAMLLAQVIEGPKHPPSYYNDKVTADVDEIVMQGMAMPPEHRFASARAMAVAIEKTVDCATTTEISEWVETEATNTLLPLAARVAEIESQSEVNVLAHHEVVPSSQRSHRLSDPEAVTTASVNSQLSSISVAGSLPLEGPGRGAGIALAAALLVGAAAGGIYYLYGSNSKLSAQPAASTTDVSVQPASTAAPPSAPSAAAATSSAEPLASALASAAASASTKPSASAAPKVAPFKPYRPSQRPADSCRPPYYYDAEGIKIWKKHCL